MKTKAEKRRQKIILSGVGLPIVLYLAIKIAPHTSEKLFGLLLGFSEILQQPFYFHLCENTPKTIALFLLVYGVIALYFIYDEREYRPNEEYGSAKWGLPKEISRKIQSPNPDNNLILTQNVKLGTDNVYQHQMAINVGVIGDPGSGKSRGVIMPALMQMFGSYIVLDPSGELLATVGRLLKKYGYEIRVLNLKDPKKSDHFNSLHYVNSSLEVVQLAEIFWKATTDKKAQKGEQFWDDMAKGLFIALAEYLYEVAPPEEQTLPMICELMEAAVINEDKPDAISPLDVLFMELSRKNPQSFAVAKYREFRSGAGKTIKSIKVSLEAHLGRVKIPEIQAMLADDTMFLDRVSQEKTVIFCVTPVADTSLNFLVSMLYQVLFNTLYRQGDIQAEKTGSPRLPVPVCFLMDEFANVTVPEDFQNRLGTMRKYSIYCVIVLQAINQLKALYEKEWESILGMCSALLYLGGQEQSTHKYLSEALGKATIGSKNSSRTYGRMAGTSTQNQQLGRELALPDEVRKLDKSKAILLIRGQNPIQDDKYDLSKHPRHKETADGGAPVFTYDANTSECAGIFRFEPLTRSEKQRAIDPPAISARWYFPEDEQEIESEEKKSNISSLLSAQWAESDSGNALEKPVKRKGETSNEKP